MENFKTTTFIVPSGAEYEIREQNGEDEGVLSNQADAQKLMNITKFLAGIIVHSSVTGGACSVKQVLEIPLLDRYAILFQSRIFSLGNTLEFEYTCGKLPNDKDDTVLYEQDLHEFLFSDYSKVPTEEELDAKPDAIPYYPQMDGIKDLEFKTTSGKVVRWDYLDGNGEIYLMTLPAGASNRNSTLIARNLRLLVDGNWEKVSNFSLFSVKDMAEIRKEINAKDPTFLGTTTLTHPTDENKVTQYPIMAAPTFFYLTEA